MVSPTSLLFWIIILFKDKLNEVRIISLNEILIVEDDHDIYEIIKLYLVREGYIVHHAMDIAGTLDHLIEHPISLVLLDLQLPDTCGLAVCTKIRETSTTPIIFLSGRTEPDLISNCLKFESTDYMMKPFNPNELVAKINSLLHTEKS